jgi:RimJ/RimL family protein N-acetyltransferase
MEYNVRRAVPGDLGWLMDQLESFNRFFDSRVDLFSDKEHAVTFLSNLIETHLVLISEASGTPTGFIAGYIIPHLFNPKIKVLAEMFWWVDEAHRGGRSGLMLLNAFTAWGKENVDWITMGLESKSPVSDRCLISRGYQLKERSYLMEVS